MDGPHRLYLYLIFTNIRRGGSFFPLDILWIIVGLFSFSLDISWMDLVAHTTYTIWTYYSELISIYHAIRLFILI